MADVMTLQAYLASSGSEEDGPSRDPAKYQALLSQAAGRQRAGGKAWGAADESEDESPDEATGLAAARPEVRCSTDDGSAQQHSMRQVQEQAQVELHLGRA